MRVPLCLFFLIILGSVGFAQNNVADLVLLDLQVLRCDAAMNETDAVAIKGDRIVALGKEQVTKWIDPGTTRVIRDSKLVATAGFADSHLHFVGLGQSLQMLDLRDAKSWQEIIAMVEKTADTLPAGTWIEGRGWHQSKWNRKPAKAIEGYPGHETMSARVPHHPVVLTHASGHACFANATAMKLAGVTAQSKDPAGGEILRDGAGDPIGVFRENAQRAIRLAQSRSEQRRSADEKRNIVAEQIRLAGEQCLQHGITSVHDAGSSFALADLFTQFANESELPVRVYMMIRAGANELAARMPDAKRIGVGDEFFTVRSVKISIDGALGPHGAWLLNPYSDLTTSAGLNTFDVDEMAEIAGLCRKYQWQLCVHAIGDRANREVLNTFEAALGDDVDSDHRWRVEHAQHLSPQDIPRFGKLGVIPAMQANHCTSDAIFVPMRLGERRSKEGAYVWRSLIDSGAVIPNGTDAPVERVDPRVSLHAAVTRKLSNGEAFYPGQCMTRAEGLLSYTLWPAISAFQERKLGSIEIGKRADIVLWDRNLITCPAEEILEAKVRMTILGGNVVYESN
ncbi:MAG: amidohydrolase [Planctomycetota bacterium]|nr:amidohydrolase [Planctomycetota bacterium]